MLRLKGKHTYLRPLDGSDVQALFAYRSLPEVYQYQGWQPSTLTDAANFVDEHTLREGSIQVGRWHQLGICLLHDDVLAGDCGFHLLSSDTAMIGYTVAPDQQKKGVGSDAVQTMVQYLFEDIGLQRILARTLKINEGSVALLRKLGFARVADETARAVMPDVESDEWLFVQERGNGLRR